MSTYSWQVPGNPSLDGTPYATQEMCEFYAGGAAELIQMINNIGDPSAVLDPEKFLMSISGAQALVDQYLGKQRRVPLTQAPPAIQHITARIAVYHARAARKGVDPETHGKRYEDDIKTLEAYRDGNLTLGIEPDPPPTYSRIDGQYPVAPWKEFARKKLAGFG